MALAIQIFAALCAGAAVLALAYGWYRLGQSDLIRKEQVEGEKRYEERLQTIDAHRAVMREWLRDKVATDGATLGDSQPVPPRVPRPPRDDPAPVPQGSAHQDRRRS